MQSAAPHELRLRERPAFEPFAEPIDRRGARVGATLALWRDAADRAPPMFAPDVFLLASRLLRADELWLFGARYAGGLAAALPIARRGRTLSALRNDHTPRFDFVGDPRALATTWRALRAARPWDLLEMRRVPADSPLVTALPDLARADGCEAIVREVGRSPWFRVEGIEQRLHRRFRGDMRRLERQIDGVRLERVCAFDRGALRDLVRLEAAAWKGDAGCAIACDDRVARFYAALVRVMAPRGRASISFLRARGRRIAAQLALEDASTYYLLKVGYDPEFARYGSGQLLVRETAADAARRGLQRYDLMGNQSPWKAKWTSDACAQMEIVIYAPSIGGRARHALREWARPMAGRALRAFKSLSR